MAQTIKLKRSAQAGNTPALNQLELGEIAINTADGKMFIKRDDGTANDPTIVEVGSTGSFLPLSGGSLTGNLSLGDGVSANFGASNDLTITHTGSSSILKENGTGTFYIQGTDIVFTNSAGSERYADFTDNGAVRLYHDNSIKLSTTATGADITGILTADGLTVTKESGDIATLRGSGTTSNVQANLVFNPVYDVNARIVSARDGSGLFSRIAFETGVDNTGNTIQRLNIGGNGDISFYEDTGTTPKLFWDASAEALGIGTTAVSSFNPANAAGNLIVGSGSGSEGITIYTGNTSNGALCFADGTSSTDTYKGYIQYNHSTEAMNFATGHTPLMSLNSFGIDVTGSVVAYVSGKTPFIS